MICEVGDFALYPDAGKFGIILKAFFDNPGHLRYGVNFIFHDWKYIDEVRALINKFFNFYNILAIY